MRYVGPVLMTAVARMVLTLVLTTTLVACGGGGSSTAITVEVLQPASAPDYSGVNTLRPDDSGLRRVASASEFEDAIRNGLRLLVRDGFNYTYGPPVPALAEDQSGGADADGGGFSATNVQVEGVDEGDLVKYDGRYLYLYQPMDYGEAGRPAPPRLRVVATDPVSAGATTVAELELQQRDRDVRELYLVRGDSGTESVAAISQSWGQFILDDIATGAPVADSATGLAIAGVGDVTTRVELIDVLDPANPVVSWSLEFDGYLEGSRKIGNTLYLVSRANAIPRGMDFYPVTDEQRIVLEQQIASVPLAQLLPAYRIDDGDEQLLTDPLDCLVPGSLEAGQGSLEIVTVTAIDLAARRISDSICMNSPVSGIYSAVDNLYLGATIGTGLAGAGEVDAFDGPAYRESTAIHKIALADGAVSYRASGLVPGVLGWNQSQFRMDEFNGDLRIVTSSYQGPQPSHRLSILRDDGGGRLELISALPSDREPGAIGKPGEDIYAVRFHGARAFVVTFRRIDPLYTLDLSDPLAPRIAGELEIPGYSSYLHPISERWLLAVGYEIENNRTAGIKVELFDIGGDAARPVGQASYGKSGSWSPAIHDHRALSFLSADDGDTLRVALPINIADTPVDWSTDYYDWTATALQLFSVEGIGGDTASLVDRGAVPADHRTDSRTWPRDYPEGRGVLHGDAVFYVYDSHVLSASWSAPTQVSPEQ